MQQLPVACALDFGDDQSRYLFGKKIVYNLKTIGHILIQFCAVTYLTWFYESDHKFFGVYKIYKPKLQLAIVFAVHVLL